MKRTLRLLQNIFISDTPIYVIFFVTSFCNARCKMCFNWKNIEEADREQELKLEEIKKIFSNFSRIQQLTLSGGEPYLRDDLPQILEFISKKNDVQMITIPTNGILSDKIFEKTKDILNRIKKDTHLRISLSVEGVEESHDEIVQVKGAFKKIQDTYRKLQSLAGSYKNLNTDISLCCSVFNKKDFKNLIKYCNECFRGCSIEPILARGNTRDKFSKEVSRSEYREILDYFYKLKGTKKDNKPFSYVIDTLERIVNRQVIQIMKTKKMPGRCYAYSKMIVLQSNADVFPCEYLDKKLGNLRDYNYDIKKILNQKDNRDVEKFIQLGNCFCTWECALTNNIVCNLKSYPRFFKELIFS